MSIQSKAIEICKTQNETKLVCGEKTLNAHYKHQKGKLPLLVFPKRVSKFLARLREKNIPFAIRVPMSNDFTQATLEFPQEVTGEKTLARIKAFQARALSEYYKNNPIERK